MKRPCLLRRRWPWLGLLMVPVAAWALVLMLAPTEWAKSRLVARLTKATGRSVHIGSLRLGILGNLQVVDLTIAERNSPTDPWLRVREARMDVHLGQILCGNCEPHAIQVNGFWLRVWRKQDGTPEIGDLLCDRSGPSSGPERAKASDSKATTIQISGGEVQIRDDPSGTRLDFSEIEATGTRGRRVVTIDEWRGKLNGGTVALAARLDRDPAGPRFEAEIRTSAVEIDPKMPVLGFFIPVVAGATEGLGGKFDLALAIKGQGTTRAEVRRSLKGQGSLKLEPIDLEDSKFLAQLDVLGEWSTDRRIGSVASDFVVDKERITTDDLTIRVSRFPFVLGGWTNFDGQFDYSAKVDQITAKLPREAKGLLTDMKVHFEQLAGLRMKGSIDKIDVTVHGHPLTGDPKAPDNERAKFRDTARRIRDRFFR